ncbi:portal protein p19, partial [Acinetobacter baumannii]
EWVDKDIIEDKYGASAVVDFAMSEYSDWCNTEDKTVLIVEYFKIEEVSDELWMLEDGTTNYKSALLDEFGVSEDELKPLVINSRSTIRTEVKWYKASGAVVLEETVFPGKYIPVIPVYGEVTYIGEERYLHSLVHFAKDPQRLYNYWKSTEAQILQKNQDDILVVDPKGVSGYEEEWRDPSKFAAVHYKHIDDSQQPIPAPYRIGAAQPPGGVLNAAESAKVAITDILNMHAPIMGGDSQEVSGVAIGMRQRQSETAQFHLQDNLNKSIRHAGRILLGLYQALYTVPMVRRIIGADGEAKQINLFDKTADGVLADVTIGRYDVRMDTGPSFNTQREQNFALMMQLLSMNPQLFSLIGDILLQNSPLLNAKEISERIRSTMPPQVLGKGEQIDPEQAKAQIQQLDQLVQKMTAD